MTCYYYAASQYYVRRCSLLLPTKQRGLSVGPSLTVVSLAKMAEPIEMPFGLWAQMGPMNRVLHEGPYAPMGGGNFEGGKGQPFAKL